MAKLTINIAGNAQAFEDELAKVSKKTKALETQLASISKLSGAAFAGLTATVGLSVKAFADFDTGMRNVRTLLNDASFGATKLADGFEKMQDDILQVAGDLPVSIDGLNKALFDTVSAGIDASKAVDTVRVASQLAVAGVTDVSVATDGMTSALNAYGLSADQANNVAAKFFSAQVQGKTTVEEMSRGFGLVGASASAMGVSLDELLGSVSAVTTAGVRTKAAYTGMKAVLANIAKPTADAAAEAKRLGIEFDAAALRTKGLKGFLDQLTQSNNFTKDSVTRLFGSVEAQNIIFALTGQQAGNFAKNLKILGNEQQNLRTFQNALNTQMDSATTAFSQFTKQIQILAIRIGKELEPTVSMLIRGMTSLIGFFAQNPVLAKFAAAVLGVGTALTGVITVATTGTLAFIKLRNAMIVASQASNVLKFGIRGLVGATGVGLLFVAIGLLAENWEEVWKFMQRVYFAVLKNFQKGFEGLKELLLGVVTLNTTTMKSGMKTLAEAVSQGWDEVTQANLKKLKDNNKEIEDEQKKANQAALDLEEDHQSKVREKRVSAKVQMLRDDAEFQAMLKEQGIQLTAEEEEKLAENLMTKREMQLKHFDEMLKDKFDFEAQKKEADLQAKIELMRQDKDFQARLKEQNIQLSAEEERRVAESYKTERERQLEHLTKIKKAKEKHNKELTEQEKSFRDALHFIGIQANDEEASNTMKAFGEMQRLQSSNNKALKAAAKPFALTMIAIRGAEAAMNIYAGFSTIPFVGHALGILGAASAIAFSAEQAGRVIAANRGGVISGGLAGRDSVPAMLTPGELVTPTKNFDETVNAVAAGRVLAGTVEENRDRGGVISDSSQDIVGQGAATTRVIIELNDDAARLISAKQIETRELGLSREF